LNRFNVIKLIGGEITSLLASLELDINFAREYHANDFNVASEFVGTITKPTERRQTYILYLLSLREFITTKDITALSPLITERNLYAVLHFISRTSPTGQVYCRYITDGYPTVVTFPTFKSKLIVTSGKPISADKTEFTITYRPPKLVPYTAAEREELLEPIRRLMERYRDRIGKIQDKIIDYKRKHNLPPNQLDRPNVAIHRNIDISNYTLASCVHAKARFPGIRIFPDFSPEEGEFVTITDGLRMNYITAIFDDINANRHIRHPQFQPITRGFIRGFKNKVRENYSYFDIDKSKCGIYHHFLFMFDAILYHSHVVEIMSTWNPYHARFPPHVTEDVNYNLDAISINYKIQFYPQSNITDGETSIITDSSVSSSVVHTSENNICNLFYKFFETRQYAKVKKMIDEINNHERRNRLQLSHPFDYLMRQSLSDGLQRTCIIKYTAANGMMWKNKINAIPYSFLKHIERIGFVYHSDFKTSLFEVSNVTPNYIYSSDPRTLSELDFRETLAIDDRYIDEYLSFMNSDK